MWDQGRMREGLDSMDAAFKLLTGDAPDADLASLAAQIGRFAFFAGDGQRGLERVETALAIAESLDLPETLSQALNTKALILGSRGREHESRALMRYALDVALEHDKPSAALRAYNNLADFFMQDDRFAEAQSTVDQGLLLARRAGNRYWEQIFLGVIYPQFALGEWSAALAMMEELGGWDEHTQARTAFTQGLVAFGVAIHVNRGDLANAERIVGIFRDLADSPDSQERTEYAAARAFAGMATGDYRGALEAATEAASAAPDLGASDFRVKEAQVLAVDAAIALGDVPLATRLVDELTPQPAGQKRHLLVAHAMRLKAALGALTGEDAGVEDGLKGAIGLFRELSYPYWTARSLLEQGTWLAASGRSEEAEASLAESRTIFAGLDATPWLERVDAARGATSSPAA
jgi:tetratricopeptide (TPR) repeat protein